MLSYTEKEKINGSDISNRLRTTDSLSWPDNIRSTWWDNNPGSTKVDGTPYNSMVCGSKKVMQDQVIGSFKKRSSSGEIFMNRLSSKTVWAEILSSGGCAFMHTNTPNNGIHYWGDVEGLFIGPVPKTAEDIYALCLAFAENDAGLKPDIAKMTALASTQARANIATPDYQGLVALGELAETLRYLKNPFASAFKLADTLKRRLDRIDPSNRKVADQVAALYLEFRYAVRPLVKDVEQALSTLVDTRMSNMRHTARAKQEYNQSNSATGPSSTAGISYNKQLSAKRTTIVRCGFLYEDEAYTGVQDTWGMRLSDLPTAMWELFPLTFVYDWIGNVGAFISAITPVGGIKHRGSWTTVIDRVELTLTGTDYTLGQPGWATTRSSSNSYKMGYETKVRNPGVALPSVEFKGFDAIEHDALKVFDLIGIFGQKLSNAAGAKAVRASKQELLERQAARLDHRVNSFRTGVKQAMRSMT